MISRTHYRVAAAVGAAVLVAVTANSAVSAPQNAVQPQAVTGNLIVKGADGAPRTLMCPPEENAMGGGFSVSPGAGRHFESTPSDVLASRPTADATGWTVAVRKLVKPVDRHHHAEPANLTLYVVCTQGENTPGG
ncbi:MULTISPECIES: hypothetical protein [unclassified Streptomyces]|uniref:hypothetical protein n=1 Tax=unclassified Streptomyces TaxID=2593676 RepID=UPI002E2A4EAF|nr:hypothetical protein [Streptomyces sp. NBC_00223]